LTDAPASGPHGPLGLANPGRRHGLTWAGACTLAPALTLSACALGIDDDHAGDDAPSVQTLQRRPRVAWVFSSGGPRGFVHVGVLKALHEQGLAPDLIVGASAGALLGVLRAGGLTGPELETLALELQPLALARLAGWTGLWREGGERFSGAAVAGLVRDQLQARGLSGRLQDLPLPAVCVAQRLTDGAVQAFNHGDAGLAVQAAAAIPGQFVPVRIRGQLHADADGQLPLPVRVARQLGATRVLAVDASAHEERAPPGAERYRAGDLRKRALTQPDAEQADVLLHPDFGYWVSLSQAFRERAIAAGYRDTMAAAARLRALHAA
jgi:NTE family protein